MTEFSQRYMLDYLLLELDSVQGTIGIEYGQLLDEKKLTMSTHRLEKKVELFLKQNSSLLFISHPLS